MADPHVERTGLKGQQEGEGGDNGEEKKSAPISGGDPKIERKFITGALRNSQCPVDGLCFFT